MKNTGAFNLHSLLGSNEKDILEKVREISNSETPSTRSLDIDTNEQIKITSLGIMETVRTLLKQNCPIKIIAITLFEYWCIFTIPGYKKDIINSSPKVSYKMLSSIVSMARTSIKESHDTPPDSELFSFTPELLSIKDNIAEDIALEQLTIEEQETKTSQVNLAFHLKIIGYYIQKGYNVEAIANALFINWVRLLEFLDITFTECQKLVGSKNIVVTVTKDYLKAVDLLLS